MRNILSIAALCALAACSTAQTASVTSTVSTSLTTAQADLQKAVTVYQTVKGIALVAEVAEPSLAPTINQAIGILDPLMATAQQMLASAQTDAPTVEALAQQINTQASTLELTAAPAVKVVAGVTK